MDNQSEAVLQKPRFKDLFWAYCIDYLIGLAAALVFCVVGFIIFIFVFNITNLGRASSLCIVIGGALLWWILVLLYYAIQESRTGATIGKKLFHVLVISKTKLPHPTFGKLMIAYFVDFLAGIVSQLSQRLVMIILTMCAMPKILVALCGIFVGIFMWVFYFAFREYKYGCTLGKKLMGLQVVQKEETK